MAMFCRYFSPKVKKKDRLTRIQIKIRVLFESEMYISELSNIGMIQDKASLKLTEKGKQYLVEYGNDLDFEKVWSNIQTDCNFGFP